MRLFSDLAALELGVEGNGRMRVDNFAALFMRPPHCERHLVGVGTGASEE